jgi:hypothetical protein
VKIWQSDLERVLVVDAEGETFYLISFNSMADASDAFQGFDPNEDADCKRCHENDSDELFRWFIGTPSSVNEDTGNWECTRCVLKRSEETHNGDVWYIAI